MAATARNVDLTNAQGSNFKKKHKPEGDYLARIAKADDHQPNDKTKPLGWVLTVVLVDDQRATYPIYLSPEPKQAWKIAQVCHAAGIKVPKGRIKFDPNRLVNKTIGVALVDDEYEGRMRSSIDDTFPKDEVGPNADEGVEDVDTDDEEIVDDTIEDDDDDEVDEEPEPAPKKRRVAKKRAPEPEPEDDEEEDDEEDEPVPAPAPKKRVRKKAPPPPADDEDDDLEDLETDDLDD